MTDKTDRAYDAQKKRIVCWFSCGAASAVATKLVLSQFANQEVVIARCIVREEHPDNDRFAADCERWFGQPIVNLIAKEYDGSVFNVITKRKYISGVDGAPCTMLLKKEVRLAFQRPTDRHVFGYCSEEQERYDSFLDANNIDCIVPLIDRGLSHADCLSMLQTAGIKLPEMYRLGYKHNNCIGCVKASGAGYWNKIRQDFPERFWMMAGASRALGVKMTRSESTRIYLDELPVGIGRYQDEPEIQCGIFCEMANNEIKENT
jgi:3'-phosphoadenosine 5'-phosphosulfate sulfotransferase (PAPS reductase)/FAD synthetase